MKNKTRNHVESSVTDESQQSAQPQEQVKTNAEASGARKIGTFHEFVRSVGVALGLNSDEYLEFTQFLRDHHTGTGLFHDASRIGKLLEGHLKLLVQFNRFYGGGGGGGGGGGDKQHIMAPQEDPVMFNEAFEFNSKIKREFRHDGRYKAYLDILRYFHTMPCNRKILTELCLEILSAIQAVGVVAIAFFTILSVSFFP